MKWKNPNNEVPQAKEKRKEGAKSLRQVIGEIRSCESNNSRILTIAITDLERRVQRVNLRGTQALIDCLLPHLGINASELVSPGNVESGNPAKGICCFRVS